MQQKHRARKQKRPTEQFSLEKDNVQQEEEEEGGGDEVEDEL